MKDQGMAECSRTTQHLKELMDDNEPEGSGAGQRGSSSVIPKTLDFICGDWLGENGGAQNVLKD